jgi:hypothetical protein
VTDAAKSGGRFLYPLNGTEATSVSCHRSFCSRASERHDTPQALRRTRVIIRGFDWAFSRHHAHRVLSTARTVLVARGVAEDEPGVPITGEEDER